MQDVNKKIYCSNCGKHIPATSKYCWNCGAPQRGLEAAAFRAEATPVERPTTPAPEIARTSSDPELYNQVIAKRHLDPAAIWLFFINYVGKTFLVVPIFAIGTYYEPIVGIGFAAYIVVTYLIAVLVYNHFFFSIGRQRIAIEYGILHKRHASVPFDQVQNVNIIRTFIDRLLGIARLEVESAGSSSIKRRDIVGGTKSKAEVFLPGLNIKTARKFHDIILHKALHERDT